MGLLDGLNSAQVFERGTYLTPGSYVLELTKLLVKQTQKSGDCFIAEFRVLESNNPAHAVGSKASWVQPFKNRTIALSSIKEFTLAILGVKPTDKAGIEKVSNGLEAVLNSCTSEPDSNELIGSKVRCDVTLTKTQKGGDFNRHDWSVYTEE